MESRDFRLPFTPDQITIWADRYPKEYDNPMVDSTGPFMRAHGYLTKEHLVALARWKSRRIVSRIERNAPDFVEAVTRLALSTPNERLRIEVLRLLDGVNWSMASVVLHFGASDPYPILDYRALESLGWPKRTSCDFDFWQRYTDATRQLAQTHGVSMRTLDRALWAYSKHGGTTFPNADAS